MGYILIKYKLFIDIRSYLFVNVTFIRGNRSKEIVVVNH